MDQYRGSPKHKIRPNRGRKGTVCPKWFHIASKHTFHGDPMAQVLTEHRLHGKVRKNLSCYLSPLIDWLICKWTWLLLEQSYLWPDKSGQQADVAILAALEHTIAAADEADRSAYVATHAWWARHALRAADASALYPDIYIRRVEVDIEVSWLARQPEFAPNGFTLILATGYALLPVCLVAEPLWQFLAWAIHTTTAADRQLTAELATRFMALNATPLSQLEQAYVGAHIQGLLLQARADGSVADESIVTSGLPVIESLAPAVLMFCGLNVDLGKADVVHLLGFLETQRDLSGPAALAHMQPNPESECWLYPYKEGYRLADDCRDALGITPTQIYVDIEAVLAQLQIPVLDAALDTPRIRGVAVARKSHGPAIMGNSTSAYNKTQAVRRFKLAHQLCHILHDRTRARKLSHLSGSWASARTKKCANDFAAMLLPPVCHTAPAGSGHPSAGATVCRRSGHWANRACRAPVQLQFNRRC